MGKNKSKKKPRTEFQKMRSLNAKLDKWFEKNKKDFTFFGNNSEEQEDENNK